MILYTLPSILDYGEVLTGSLSGSISMVVLVTIVCSATCTDVLYMQYHLLLKWNQADTEASNNEQCCDKDSRISNDESRE